MDAFFDLDTDRDISEHLMAIPWSSINRYCDAYGFAGELREDMLYFIRRMDEAYLEAVRAKRSRAHGNITRAGKKA